MRSEIIGNHMEVGGHKPIQDSENWVVESLRFR